MILTGRISGAYKTPKIYRCYNNSRWVLHLATLHQSLTGIITCVQLYLQQVPTTPFVTSLENYRWILQLTPKIFAGAVTIPTAGYYLFNPVVEELQVAKSTYYTPKICRCYNNFSILQPSFRAFVILNGRITGVIMHLQQNCRCYNNSRWPLQLLTIL